MSIQRDITIRLRQEEPHKALMVEAAEEIDMLRVTLQGRVQELMTILAERDALLVQHGDEYAGSNAT